MPSLETSHHIQPAHELLHVLEDDWVYQHVFRPRLEKREDEIDTERQFLHQVLSTDEISTLRHSYGEDLHIEAYFRLNGLGTTFPIHTLSDVLDGDRQALKQDSSVGLFVSLAAISGLRRIPKVSNHRKFQEMPETFLEKKLIDFYTECKGYSTWTQLASNAQEMIQQDGIGPYIGYLKSSREWIGNEHLASGLLRGAAVSIESLTNPDGVMNKISAHYATLGRRDGLEPKGLKLVSS